MACEVCSHAQREAIERGIKKGGNLQFIADRYGMTDDMLRRHRDGHMAQLPVVVGKEREAEVIRTRMDPVVLFEEHDECIAEAKKLIAWSTGERGEDGFWIRDPDARGWALGVREWRGCLDQKNRLLGLYDHVDPRLQRTFAARVIQVVSHALEQFPEARDTVLRAIDEIEKEDA